ncbi:MAG: MFS transporter [Thermoanaerobaculaceae bacterium]
MKLNSRQWAWCLYDWANSAFALVCMTALLPVALTQAANRELGAPQGTVVWGWFATAGLGLSVALSPVLGHWADKKAKRKALLAFSVAIGALCCLGMGPALEERWFVAGLLYTVGASAFALGNVLYDALLLVVASPGEWDRISSAGYAAGYLGGALALVGSVWLWQVGAYTFAFALVGGWWLLFSLPLLLLVPEPRTAVGLSGWVSLRDRFRELKGNRWALRFLGAYWLYNDGISTVIKMAGSYGSHLGIPLGHLVGALLFAQAVGVPSTLLFGRLASRWGAKRLILLALMIYTGVTLWATGIRQVWEFWLLAGLVGSVQGGAQALSRSFFARFVPPGGAAAYFGFFDVSGRLAGLLGPALFALATGITGAPAFGVAVTTCFFLVGGVLLATVPEDCRSEASPQTLKDF